MCCCYREIICYIIINNMFNFIAKFINNFPQCLVGMCHYTVIDYYKLLIIRNIIRCP